MSELMTKAGPAHGSLSITVPRTAPTILVVDDHADTRALLRCVFERQHYEVSEAADGLEAIALAQRLLPDLIVMDTSLKDMDGLEATRRIRRMPNIGTVPIVFLSGHAQPQARDIALACGASDYLVKPVSIDELERTVQRQLAAARQKVDPRTIVVGREVGGKPL